jgi:sarcosine oxidase subunit beta
MEKTYDTIIIGGGIHGVSTAFHLAQRSVKSLVVEKSTLASQATGRSSGLIRMHYALETEARLAWESFQYFRDWGTRVGGDCGFVRTGFMQFVTPEYTDLLKVNIANHQSIGIPSFLVTAADVQRLAPHFILDDIEVAAYEPESGYADPSATTASLMDAARQSGARLLQDCSVIDIIVKSGRIAGVITPQGEFSAPIVVNAAGSWAGEVAKMVGVDLPITPFRHDVMYIQRPEDFGPPHPTVIDDLKKMYFRPETGGLTLVGLEDGNQLGGSPDGFVDRAQPGYVARAIDRICQRIPVMERASLHSDHGGYDGITPDQRPVIGHMGPEGFFLQCGFSGFGFKIAPAIGACMAELILDGEAKTVDISSFGPRRFIEGKLIKGDHLYDVTWE